MINENIYTVTGESVTPYLPYIFKNNNGILPSSKVCKIKLNDRLIKEVEKDYLLICRITKEYGDEYFFKSKINNHYILFITFSDYYVVEYFFFEEHRNIIEDCINNIEKNKKYHYKIKTIENTENLYCLIKDYNGYSLIKNTNKNKKIDIDLNYNDHVVNEYENLINYLKNNKIGKGLTLFHGEAGTGKTRFIRHLSMIVDKKFIIVPPTHIPSMSGPDFLTFLIKNKGCILVLEDSDDFLIERGNIGSGQNTAISSILNISDGILSDFLDIKIIATFNSDIKKLDKALLRKGRLFKKIDFGKLSVDKSNNLLKKLNIDYITDDEMSLTEIYNFKENNIVESTIKPKTKKVGF